MRILLLLSLLLVVVKCDQHVGQVFDVTLSTASCLSDGLVWYQCPDGYGIANGTDKGENCCPDHYACPQGFTECTSTGACCQDGFGVFCSNNGGTYCCQDGYYCGTNGGCYSGGSCECEGCLVNPCIGVGCGDCEKCCNAYIGAGLCKSWQCSAGTPGKPNVGTALPCTSAAGAEGSNCGAQTPLDSQPYCCPKSAPTCNNGFSGPGTCCEGTESQCGLLTSYASCCDLPTYSQCCANNQGYGCCEATDTCCGNNSGCCCDSLHPVCCNAPEYPGDCSTGWCCNQGQECGTESGTCVNATLIELGVPAKHSSSYNATTNTPKSLKQSQCCNDFECYGNWCGRADRCNSAEMYKNQSAAGLPLCDNIDAVCQAHDNCYESNEQNTCCCDQALVAAMTEIHTGIVTDWQCPLPRCHSPTTYTLLASELFSYKPCTCQGMVMSFSSDCKTCPSNFVKKWTEKLLTVNRKYIEDSFGYHSQ